MARRDQRQRQAERRAARLAARGEAPAGEAEGRAQPDGTPAELEAGAPPEELGRSDLVVEPELDPLDEDEDPELAYEAEEAGALATVDLDDERSRSKGHATPAQEHEREHHRERGKVLGFLANVWAELQRVQWPNRQQVTTLTGVVLGFVLIAGGYLGLLDAIFSRVIEQIL